MDLFFVFLAVFACSLAFIIWTRIGRGDGEVKAQFLVTGLVLTIFYIVCFCSGVCTILNFLFRWVL